MNIKKQKLNIIDELADIENNNSTSNSNNHDTEKKSTDLDNEWSNVLGVQIEPGNQSKG